MAVNTDTLSLTLPKPTSRTRVRWRKPRHPSWEELFWLGATLWAVTGSVQAWLDGALPWMVLDTICTVVYWRAYHRARRRHRPYIPLSVAVVLLAAWASMNVAGVPA